MSLFLNTNFITLLQMVLLVAVAGTRRATLPIVVCMLSIFLGVRLYNAPEVEPAPITLQPPQPFPVNNALNASHVAMHWGVHGPETFAVGPDGWIYTGTADGRIVKFQSAHMQPVEVVRTGKLLRECGSYAAEPECGRPLGMQFNSAGKLIVCDGYYGLLEVDVQVGRIEVLATEAEGRHFVFLNSLVTDAPDGNYYITESSGRHTRRDVSLEVMEAQPTGRLLKFDPRTRTMTVLLRDQPFPNGLTLSHDKTELLMCLWSKMQVVAYSLKDAQVRVVADNLPGPPDNITPRPNGQSYWVALSFYRNPEFSLYDMTAAMPRVRWLMLKLFGPRWFVSILAARDGMIVEMDGSGRLLSSLMDRTGTIFYLSEAFEHEGHLYLGSFINPFLGKVPVSEVVQH